MRKIYLISIGLFLINSCVFIRTDDSIDLGDKYRYIQDYPQAIMYHKSDEYDGLGIYIVPPVVIDYKFNEYYIIAKSQEEPKYVSNQEITTEIFYWIIDKKEKGASVRSLDSISFYRKLKELNIELKF